MKIHYLQHVPFEGPGVIKSWAEIRGCRITSTALFKEEELPDPSSIDALIILGGPMNVYDEGEHPWLFKEKKFILQCIRRNKKVLGICLGAQLIASVLGAGVYSNRVKEIGWFYIYWNRNARTNSLFDFLPCRQITFHWHEDTFKLPAGAIRLASSRCCKNQAFIYKNDVVGFQFHLEMEQKNLIQLINHNIEELKQRGPHIQSAGHILDRPEYLDENNQILIRFLDRFFLQKFKTEPEVLTAGKHY